MRYTLVGLTATAVIALGAGAQAAPLGATGGLAAASTTVNLAENAQFLWGGFSYCWYFDGWRGPGWYRCGFAWRRGFGWGGPRGWRSWAAPGPYPGGPYGGPQFRYGGPRFYRGGPPPAFGGRGPGPSGGPGPGRGGPPPAAFSGPGPGLNGPGISRQGGGPRAGYRTGGGQGPSGGPGGGGGGPGPSGGGGPVPLSGGPGGPGGGDGFRR